MVVVFSSFVALLTVFYVMGGAEAGTQRWKSIRKTNVVGFFAQDLAETNETTFDYVRDNSSMQPREKGFCAVKLLEVFWSSR